MVDFSKYQTSDQKLPEEKISPGDKDQKVAHARPKKKNIQDKKNSNRTNSDSGIDQKKSMDPYLDLQTLKPLIETKIKEIVKEILLKLLNIGVIHDFTRENVLKYIRIHKGTKEGQLSNYFDPIGGREIQKMVKKLHSTGFIKKDKNNFYIIK